MSRYVTDTEKEGVKRRTREYYARKAALGLTRRSVLATASQALVLQGVAAEWNGGESFLTPEQKLLAAALNPDADAAQTLEGKSDADQS